MGQESASKPVIENKLDARASGYEFPTKTLGTRESLYYSKGCGGAPLFNPIPNPSENVKKNTVCFTGIAAYLIWNLKGCVFGPAGCAADLMTPGF